MRRFFLALLLAPLALTSCSIFDARDLSRSEEVFGTPCTIRIVAGGSKTSLDLAFAKLHEFDGMLNPGKADSEISAVNRAAGKEAVKVSAETYSAIESALEFSKITGGVTDLTAGPLVNLWGIGTDHARVPSQREIDAALKLIDWKRVRLFPATSEVELETKGMALDLGAFAKGWAADRAKQTLAASGAKAAIIDLGGNIFVFGAKKDGKPWKIGIQNPAKQRGEYMGIVTTFGDSVTTAGTYERFFIADGVKYHHILDLATGRPALSGLQSVTVIAETSTLADGIDTALLILGREKGMALAAKTPGVAAVFVGDDRRVWMSPGANKSFRLTDESDWSLSE